MSKSRMVNTQFWDDNYVMDLDPIEKLLFLYLLTNQATNMLGIYELHIRRIAFDTGIDKDMVLKIFDRFDKADKAKYVDGYVILKNFTKHQSYNDKMKVSAINTYEALPNSIKNNPDIIPIIKGMEPLPKGIIPFPKGSKPMGELEYELEYEKELEVEEESEKESETNSLVNIENVDEAERVADYLLKSIKTADPTHKYHKNKPALRTWIKDIDKAMRLDGRTEQQLMAMIEYIFHKKLETSLFWRGNIESGAKLRKHFDTIKNKFTHELKKIKHEQPISEQERYHRSTEFLNEVEFDYDVQGSVP